MPGKTSLGREEEIDQIESDVETVVAEVDEVQEVIPPAEEDETATGRLVLSNATADSNNTVAAELQGSATNISLFYRVKGTGSFSVGDAGDETMFSVSKQGSGNAVAGLDIATPVAADNALRIAANSQSLTDLSIEVQPMGNGKFRSSKAFQTVSENASAWANLLSVIPFPLRVGNSVTTHTAFIADRRWRIVKAQAIFSQAGSDGGAVTLDITSETGTGAPGSGSTVLASTFDLKATANTVQTVNAANSNTTIASGSRLSFKVTGTPTDVQGLFVVLYLEDLPN